MLEDGRKEKVPTNPQILESLIFAGVGDLLDRAKTYKATSGQQMRTYEALIAIAKTPEEKAFAQQVKGATENAVSKGRTGRTDSAVAEVVSRLLGRPWD